MRRLRRRGLRSRTNVGSRRTAHGGCRTRALRHAVKPTTDASARTARGRRRDRGRGRPRAPQRPPGHLGERLRRAAGGRPRGRGSGASRTSSKIEKNARIAHAHRRRPHGARPRRAAPRGAGAARRRGRRRARRPRRRTPRAGTTRSSRTTCASARTPASSHGCSTRSTRTRSSERAARARIVTTSARSGAGRVVIEVADDGPGVPADIAARVFEPLVTARTGGTGLGLALARRIAAAHGGIDRARPGVGERRGSTGADVSARPDPESGTARADRR